MDFSDNPDGDVVSITPMGKFLEQHSYRPMNKFEKKIESLLKKAKAPEEDADGLDIDKVDPNKGNYEEEDPGREDMSDKTPPGNHSDVQPPNEDVGSSIEFREVLNDARINATKFLQAMDNFEQMVDLTFYEHVSEDFSNLREKIDHMIKSPEDYIDESNYNGKNEDNG